MGCNGGLMDYGFKYIIANGITTEDSYPYTATTDTCTKKTGEYKVSSFHDVTPNSASQLKAAIAINPVSVAIEADTQAFQFYSTGVITSDACGTNLDHGVLAVGYDTTGETPFYRVKNSWGDSWGDEGFVNIEIEDGNGICGIQMQPSYPVA